ncbi:TIM barrel protein [Leucobacter sp. CSA1]|uniref:TIM barrel protein n=1 Tax=Leucobacter chromiisoli TaxID=2796471 RepID=A0A934UUG3_9MICO|nr:TIM barrel protein [Leucobacter chromiisoli]MBK0418790.1 TIM barrel protein [Leucobacter chromiisoli]
MTEMLLGVNNCFAVKRWASPDAWLRVIREDLDLSHCQFSLDLLPPGFDLPFALRYAEHVRTVAEQWEVTIHSTFTGLGAYGASLLMADEREDREQAERWYRGVIDLTAAMGATMTGGHIGAATVPAWQNAGERRERRRQMIDAMHRLAEYADERGLVGLTFENLAVEREYGHTIEEAQQLEEALAGTAVPWVLCLDLGHPAALTTGTGSDDPTNWLRSAWRHQPLLQLQQSPRGADLHGPFTASTNAEGIVQREPVLTALDQAEWQSPVHAFLEVIPAHEADDQVVLADLVHSVRYWRGA